MSEHPTRARSALERKWMRLGQYAWVCGEWTVCNFLVNSEEVFMLYRGKETMGLFDTDRAAMEAAKEREMQADRHGSARQGEAARGRARCGEERQGFYFSIMEGK